MDSTQARDTVVRRAHESALEVFRRLPVVVRRLVTHTIAPTYSVGTVGVCVRDDRVLLVKSRHQRSWSLPGGLLERGETPADALQRELGEELGLTSVDVELDLRPHVVVDPRSRQVTVVFGVSFREQPEVDGLEVLELGWFAATDLPTTLLRGTLESLQLKRFLDDPLATGVMGHETA